MTEISQTQIQHLVKIVEKIRNASSRVPPTVFEGNDIPKLEKELTNIAYNLERRFKQLSKIQEVTERVNAGYLLEETLDYVYESFKEIIPYDRIGFSLLKNDNRQLTAHWARSKNHNIRIKKGYTAKIKGSSLESILKTKEPRIINDLESYAQEHPLSESTQLILEEGVRSSLTCPLINTGTPVGFIFFSSFQKNTYNESHQEIFKQLANTLAIILEKAKLYQHTLDLNEQKNKLIGMAAHDLRSPISGIYGLLQVMSTEGDNMPTEEREEILQMMKKSTKKILNMINKLLDISAIESGLLSLKKEPTNIHEFLYSIYQFNDSLARSKSIKLTLDIDPDLPEVNMDPQKMEQVFNNLISNAIKYSYPKTTIYLSVVKSEDNVLISVRDEGQGIPIEEQSKIFQEFARSSAIPTAGEASTGLGLAIVKKIVEAHNYHIQIESEPGKGSTFIVSIPLDK